MVENLKQKTNLELRTKHQQIHNLYKQKGEQSFIKTHTLIIVEMGKRKIKHYVVSELDRQTNLLRKKATSTNIIEETLKNKKLQLVKGALLKFIQGKKILLVDYESSLYDTLHKSGYNTYAIALEKEAISPKVILASNLYKIPFNDNNFDTVICYKKIKNELEDKLIAKELIRISSNQVIFLLDLDEGYFDSTEILKQWLNTIITIPHSLESIGENQIAVLASKQLTTIKNELINNLESYIVVPDFIHLVGSAVDTPNPDKIDILFRQDYRNPTLEFQFKRLFPKEIRKKFRFIYNPAGADSGNYIPLCHLAVIKKRNYKKMHIKPESPKLLVGKWFKPLKSKGGINKLEFFELENLWINWAESLIDKGIAVEPKYYGCRIQLHKKGKNIGLFIENDKQNLLYKLPNIQEEILSFKEKDFILDGKLVIYKSEELPMNKNEIINYLSQQAIDDTKIKLFLFDCLNHNGEYLNNKQWAQRQSYLSKIFIKDFKYLEKVASIIVRRKSDLFDAINQVKEIMNSEGAILKLLDSTYPTIGKTDNWAEFSEIHEINVKIKDIHRIKKDLYNYSIQILGERGQSIDCGTTMNSSIRCKEGDIISIAVFKIEEDKDKFNFLYPVIRKKLLSRTIPDTTTLARRIVKRTINRTEKDVNYFLYKLTYKLGTITMESGMKGRYVIQTHQKRKFVYCDLRMLVTSPKERTYLEGLTLDTPGSVEKRNKFTNPKFDEKIVCQIKAKQLKAWMRIEGNYPAGSIGATRYKSGIIRIINKGSFICGVQDEHYKEFWFETSDKKIKGRWILQYVPISEGWSKVKGKRIWILSKPKKQSMET